MNDGVLPKEKDVIRAPSFCKGVQFFHKQWIYFFFPLEYEGDGSRHLFLHKLDICELSLSWALEQDLAARKCVIEIHRLLGSAASVGHCLYRARHVFSLF